MIHLPDKRIAVTGGDGSPTREFLYFEDCADAIALASERYDRSDPVNIGAGAVVAIDDEDDMLWVITVYEPTPVEWRDGFRERRAEDDVPTM